MSQEARKILELFNWLDIEEKESLLKRLESIIVAERKEPKKTQLEEAWDDQTDLIIFLMKVAKKHDDQEKYKKLCRGAKMRRCVNYEKVEKSMALLENIEVKQK